MRHSVTEEFHATLLVKSQLVPGGLPRELDSVR